MGAVNMDEVLYITLTFQDDSLFTPHAQIKQTVGIVSLSILVNVDSNARLRLWLLLLPTLSETQWSRELHNSPLFIAPSLPYTNINAPFYVSCAHVFLSGVAKVSNHSLLSSLFASVLNLEKCTTLWAETGKEGPIEAASSIPVIKQLSSFLREV